MMRTAWMIALAVAAAGAARAQPVDLGAVARITDEGMNRSEIPLNAEYLTDRIGSRMTNSPGMRAAEAWTQAKFRGWGLANVHAEGFAFGRGWSIVSASVRMTAPRPLDLRAIPVAWTPPTAGALTAEIVVAPMRRERDFAPWRGKLAGKIVLVSLPGASDEPDKPAFQRYTDEELAKLDTYEQPDSDPVKLARQLRREAFAARLDAFLKAEGALAWARKSYRDNGLVSGEGYSFETGRTPALPGVEIAAEDYRRLARLAKTGPVTLAITSDVRFHDEDAKAYNIIAEIPGRDPRAGYVMAGAHLDSWAAADGAADNGAGSIMVMEAARILQRLGVRPRRTIRFALWAGEEQGLFGSFDYIGRYLATRPPSARADARPGEDYYEWRTRFPLTRKPGFDQLAAYFNIDNGSGKLRGVYAEGNPAATPILREWLAPFEAMGSGAVVASPTEGTDHQFMAAIGLPAFQFIQDPLDYETRVHHSNLDTYDHLRIADMKQGAVILASTLLSAANADAPLPRAAFPTQPLVTDPFAYPDPKDDD